VFVIISLNRWVTLIHDLSMDGHAGFLDWKTWLQKAQITDVNTSRGLHINNSAAVLQAAIEGRGVMAHDDVAAGRLVRLYPDIHIESALATMWCIGRNAPACQGCRRSVIG